MLTYIEQIALIRQLSKFVAEHPAVRLIVLDSVGVLCCHCECRMYSSPIIIFLEQDLHIGQHFAFEIGIRVLEVYKVRYAAQFLLKGEGGGA